MLKIYRYLKPLWWKIAISLTFVFLQAFLQLLLPPYIQRITEYITSPLYNGTSEQIRTLLLYGAEMIGISFAVLAAAICQGLINMHISASFAAILRQKLFYKLQSLSVNEQHQFGAASLLTRFNNDVRMLQYYVVMSFRVLTFAPTFLIIGIIRIAQIDPMYLLVVGAIIPIIIIMFTFVFIRAKPLYSLMQERVDYLTLLMREGLTGVRVIRAFNQQQRENRYYDEANSNLVNINKKIGYTFFWLSPIVQILFNLTYIAVFIIGFFLIDQMLATSEIIHTFGNSLVVSQYISHVMRSFMMLTFVFFNIPRASTAAKRINAVLDVNPELKDPENPIDANMIENIGIVEFKNVTFNYSPSADPILKNISFETKPGKVTAIIGSTGSGKSSIINLIPRFFEVTEGEVLVDGVNVKNYKQKDLRNRLAFIPQQSVLFSGTIRDNIKFGNEDATDDEIIEALKVAQAYDFVSESNEGLDTIVAQAGKNLSGGQKQRLAIARALIRKSKIYVFDDSFSALDFKTDVKLRYALKKYAADSTIIIVAQRINSILDADQIIVLDNGKIVGLGSHQSLLECCSVYREIVVSQLDQDEIAKTKFIAKQTCIEGGEA